MDRTLTARSPLAAAAAVLSALGLLIALTGPGLTPAAADQFTPLEDPPSIVVNTTAIMVGDPQDGSDNELTGSMIAAADESDDGSGGTYDTPYSAFTEFQPASGSTSDIYNVFATITTNGQLSNVTEIRLCLYDSNDSHYATASSIDSDCGIDDAQVSSDPLPTAASSNADPTRLMVINYDHSGPTTTVVDSENNNYTDHGTFYDVSNVTENGDGTRSATIRFSFSVSNAMQVSTGWKIRAAAESVATINSNAQDPQSAVHVPTDTFTVAYFGEMTTGRAATTGTVDYGIVTPDVTVLMTNESGSPNNSISTGTYTANDYSAITIQGTDFQNSANSATIPLAENGDIWDSNAARSAGASVAQMETAIKNVPSGTVALDCAYVESVTTTLDQEAELLDFVQVKESAAREFLIDQSATDEDGVDLEPHSCMVNYPGGGPVANVVYDNTVTLGVIQDADNLLTLGGVTAP